MEVSSISLGANDINKFNSSNGSVRSEEKNVNSEQRTRNKVVFSDAVDVELSEEGKKLSGNSQIEIKNKKKGTTSNREQWEDAAKSRRNNSRFGPAGNYSPFYLMQLDEPETYAKWEELNHMADYSNQKYGYSLEELQEIAKERDSIFRDWNSRRCTPLEQQLAKQHAPIWSGNLIERLEEKYSDSHDLSINVYGIENQDEKSGRVNMFSGSSLWRYSSKYNILLSSDTLKKLLGSSEKEDVLNRIDSAVYNMKEAEKNYEGDKVFLRFGVKFHTNGDISYHANYKDCEDSYGINANSADELLEKLMKED